MNKEIEEINKMLRTDTAERLIGELLELLEAMMNRMDRIDRAISALAKQQVELDKCLKAYEHRNSNRN